MGCIIRFVFPWNDKMWTVYSVYLEFEWIEKWTSFYTRFCNYVYLFILCILDIRIRKLQVFFLIKISSFLFNLKYWTWKKMKRFLSEVSMRISEKLDQWQENLETDSRLGVADLRLPPAAKGEWNSLNGVCSSMKHDSMILKWYSGMDH